MARRQAARRQPTTASNFTRHESVAVDLKPSSIWLAFSTAEGIQGRTDADVHKTAIFDHLLPGCTRQTTGNSGRPKIDVCYRGCWHRLTVGNVGKLKVAAGF
jgi:hypothetical protein